MSRVQREIIMNYKESVEKEIEGNRDEVKRRKKLWSEIVKVNNEGDVDAVKSYLTKEGESITTEFENLLGELEEQL